MNNIVSSNVTNDGKKEVIVKIKKPSYSHERDGCETKNNY